MVSGYKISVAALLHLPPLFKISGYAPVRVRGRSSVVASNSIMTELDFTACSYTWLCSSESLHEGCITCVYVITIWVCSTYDQQLVYELQLVWLHMH